MSVNKSKSTARIYRWDEFKVVDTSSKGVQVGSQKVTLGDDTYQRKQDKDPREFIAAALAPNKMGPEVSLVTSENNQRIYIASKYLPNVKDLDDHLTNKINESNTTIKKRRRHITIVDDGSEKLENMAISKECR